MIKREHNTHYVNKFMHPFHATECIIYHANKKYYYTDSVENHSISHYICKENEDYFDALADIFF